MMADIKRLRKYYDFDPETTLGPIADTAEWQNRMGFRELADHYNVDNAVRRVQSDGKLIEYLHLRGMRPESDSVRVLFAPFGNGTLSQNIVMRSLRLLAADNPEHMFVTAGPAHISNKANLLSHAERRRVRGGDLTPVASPLLRLIA